MTPGFRPNPWLLCLLLSSCVHWLRSEPYTYTPRVLTVRTTAYTHTEADHKKYGKKTASGTELKASREYNSAAADWSVFPFGTEFRIKGLNRHFVIDDYGSALVGKDTIDLYFTSRSQMNRWGVQYVDILITKYGDYERSQEILSQRLGFGHCRQMYEAIVSNRERTKITPTRPAPFPEWDHDFVDETRMVAASIPRSQWELPPLAVAPDPRGNDPEIIVFQGDVEEWVVPQEGTPVSPYWEVASLSPEAIGSANVLAEAEVGSQDWWSQEVPALARYEAYASPRVTEDYRLAVRIALPMIPDPEPPAPSIRAENPRAVREIVPRPRHFVPIYTRH